MRKSRGNSPPGHFMFVCGGNSLLTFFLASGNERPVEKGKRLAAKDAKRMRNKPNAGWWRKNPLEIKKGKISYGFARVVGRVLLM